MLWIILAIIVSYFIGSIPTAYIFGRLIKGIDIRKFGSGNVGATNAVRVLGKRVGVVVLILDILKGFLTVFVLGNLISPRNYFFSEETLRLILGLSCILGHIWTIFLRFKGGKGIATTFGVLLGLAAVVSNLRLVLGLLIVTWLAVFIITKIVSLSSIVSAVALPIYMVIFKGAPVFILFSVLLSIFVIFRHKSNLARLIRGEEPRLF